MIKFKIQNLEDIKKQIYGFKTHYNIPVYGIMIHPTTYRNLWLNGYIKKSEFLEDKLEMLVFVENVIEENTIKIVI